jgi:hypothetical protein
MPSSSLVYLTRVRCLITVPTKVPDAELVTADGRYGLGYRFSDIVSVTIGNDAAPVVVRR